MRVSFCNGGLISQFDCNLVTCLYKSKFAGHMVSFQVISEYLFQIYEVVSGV